MFVQSHIQRAHRHHHINNNHHNQQRQRSVATSTAATQRTHINSAAANAHSTRSNHLIERQAAIDSSSGPKSQQSVSQESCDTLRKQQKIKQRVVRAQTSERSPNLSHGRLADQSNLERDGNVLIASQSLGSDRQMRIKSINVSGYSSTTCEREQRRKLSLTSQNELIREDATRTVTAIATLRLRSSTTSGASESQTSGSSQGGNTLAHAATSQPELSNFKDISGQFEEQAKSQLPSLTNETLQRVVDTKHELNISSLKPQVVSTKPSSRPLRARGLKNRATSRRLDCIGVLVARRNSAKLNNLRILNKINLSNFIGRARRLNAAKISGTAHKIEINQCNESSFDQRNTFTFHQLMNLTQIKLYCFLLLNYYLKPAPQLILLYFSHFLIFQAETIKNLFSGVLNLVCAVWSGVSSRLEMAPPEMRNLLNKPDGLRHRGERAFCCELVERGTEFCSNSAHNVADKDLLMNYHPKHHYNQLGRCQKTRPVLLECCCNLNQHHREHRHAGQTGEIATNYQIAACSHYLTSRQHQNSCLFSGIGTKEDQMTYPASRSLTTNPQVSFNGNGSMMVPPHHHEFFAHHHSINPNAHNSLNWDRCDERDKVDLNQPRAIRKSAQHHWRPVDRDQHRRAFECQPMSSSFDEPILQPDGAYEPAKIHQRRISTSSPTLFEGEQIPATCLERLQPSEPVASFADTTTMQTQLDRRRDLETRARDNCNNHAQLQLTRGKTLAHDLHHHQRCHLTAQIAASNQICHVACHCSHANNNKTVSCVATENRPFQRKLSSIIGSDSELCKRSNSQTVGLVNFSSSSASSSLSSDVNQLIRLARPDSVALKRRPDLLSDFRECPPRRAGQSSGGHRLHRKPSSITSETSSGRRHNFRAQHPTGGRGDCPTRTFDCVSKSLVSPTDNINRNRSPSATSWINGSNDTRAPSQPTHGKSPNHRIKAEPVGGTGDDGTKRRSNSQKVNLAVSGKSKSMSHSHSPIAVTLGRVSLAGAKRRLGFKRTHGLNSLSVHRSEEIFPSDSGTGLLTRQYTSTTTTTTNTTPGSYSLNDSCDLDQQQQHRQWTGSGNGLSQNKWLGLFSSESSDPKICFVDGLGLGQIVSRQALVSPYLGDIQIGLSDRRGMLEVEVIRVRQLQPKPGAKRLPSVYVKVYLMRDKKCLAKFKTSATSNTLDPLYQQLFIFRDDYSNCVLQIIVWGDYGKHNRKSLMGIVQIHLNDVDISNMLIGWYKLFNAPSMASSQSMASSSKSLRQTLSTIKLADLNGAQQPLQRARPDDST